jgi:hypothetical protein
MDNTTLVIIITAIVAIIGTLITNSLWQMIRDKSYRAEKCVDVHDNSAKSHPDIRLQVGAIKLTMSEVLEIVSRIETKLNKT